MRHPAPKTQPTDYRLQADILFLGPGLREQRRGEHLTAHVTVTGSLPLSPTPKNH